MKKPFTSVLSAFPSWHILVRFVSEFWLPFLIAVAWTYWNWRQSVGPYDVLEKGIVNFFAAGWAFSQWNRIKKQKRNEDGLSDVAGKVSGVLENLNQVASRIEGYATGGDSIAVLTPLFQNIIAPKAFVLKLHGQFPLKNLSVRIMDLERVKKFGMRAIEENLHDFADLGAHGSGIIVLNEDAEESFFSPNETTIIVYVTATNGSTVQTTRYLRVDNVVLSATKIEKKNMVIYEDISPDYPRDANGEIDWGEATIPLS